MLFPFLVNKEEDLYDEDEPPQVDLITVAFDKDPYSHEQGEFHHFSPSDIPPSNNDNPVQLKDTLPREPEAKLDAFTKD